MAFYYTLRQILCAGMLVLGRQNFPSDDRAVAWEPGFDTCGCGRHDVDDRRVGRWSKGFWQGDGSRHSL